MGVDEGTELLAIGEGDTLLLKKIEKTSLKKEFEETSKRVRDKAKKLGITKKDVEKAIKEAREN